MPGAVSTRVERKLKRGEPLNAGDAIGMGILSAKGTKYGKATGSTRSSAKKGSQPSKKAKSKGRGTSTGQRASTKKKSKGKDRRGGILSSNLGKKTLLGG
jgi:hypothetical protein